jgi:hypothetical protein
MVAREKLLTKRLQMVAQDMKASERQVKDLSLAARKSDAKLAQIGARVANSR